MDKSTFETLVRESELTLYRVSKSILYNDSDCADAVQEAILNAYKKLHTLKEERYFKTWLTRILIRECYRIQKSNSRFVPYEEYLAEQETTTDYSDLHTALKSLPDELRIVTVLFYMNGFSTAEIAGILKIPKGTVNSRMARARRELKKTLVQERTDIAWIS